MGWKVSNSPSGIQDSVLFRLLVAQPVQAVHKKYKAATRAKALTALPQLCEVKCGDYLAESCFDEDFKASSRQNVYSINSTIPSQRLLTTG